MLSRVLSSTWVKEYSFDRILFFYLIGRLGVKSRKEGSSYSGVGKLTVESK